MSDAIYSRVGKASIYPTIPINFGGLNTIVNGIGRNDEEGSPAAPSLVMQYPGRISFRWVVRTGTRTVSVLVKQASNVTPRPTLTIKANSALGIPADLVATASSAVDWVTIGPVTFTPTARGVVQVELECYNREESEAGCFWDNLIMN